MHAANVSLSVARTGLDCVHREYYLSVFRQVVRWKIRLFWASLSQVVSDLCDLVLTKVFFFPLSQVHLNFSDLCPLALFLTLPIVRFGALSNALLPF